MRLRSQGSTSRLINTGWPLTPPVTSGSRLWPPLSALWARRRTQTRIEEYHSGGAAQLEKNNGCLDKHERMMQHHHRTVLGAVMNSWSEMRDVWRAAAGCAASVCLKIIRLIFPQNYDLLMKHSNKQLFKASDFKTRVLPKFIKWEHVQWSSHHKMVDTSHAQYGCSRWSYDEKATQGNFITNTLLLHAIHVIVSILNPTCPERAGH